ncbi:hypothetical protein SAMN05216223_102106 [Actinacidiphila yanglinensis]|uniref:Uncharacterized protein n=1 Tax=Actinacidiphila yanglinensis TaxID=310779 RepID=A0A1H5V167_9ACTN|nr:hypothetical protein [Actinacidiphila yanglinensis]SEF81115.1 hypothetical protein SAMN05216223_102106 [Actinacidiphila yanglinensis]
MSHTPVREHATSNATRLLSAGTYLDPIYRRSVIKELMGNRFRVVAPAFGYDTVSVLAHALAAHKLRRDQLLALAAGTVLLVVLMVTGAIGVVLGLLTLVWLVWAAAFLRRIATLRVLTKYLRPADGKGGTGGTGGFDGGYPLTRALTDDLVRKVAAEQSADRGVVLYGGYRPFVGAGVQVHRWSNAELLVGARLGLLDEGFADPAAMPPGMLAHVAALVPEHVPEHLSGGGTAAGTDAPRRKEVIPFTVDKITGYVAARMTAELHDEAPPQERIESLTVERRKYTTAVVTTDRPLREWEPAPDASAAHWDERYDAAREYLCVRVGSWDEELVVSMFVGFDLKGNTLHTEFYTYVLPPLIRSFHLADRLPPRLGGRLMARVAWHVVRSAPSDLARLVLNPLRERLPRRLRRGRVLVEVDRPIDTSEFRLGRYALTTVNRGALLSVREMATRRDFPHFFQESDTIKYTRIVERRLLQIIRTFLAEHNVDLADHDAQQLNILQQHFGDNNNNSGTGNTMNTRTGGNRTSGANSPIRNGA